MFGVFSNRIIIVNALLLFLIKTVNPYNIDTKDPVIYKDPEPGGENFFGYSLALKSGRSIPETSEPAIFIGAPKLSGEVGGVYRCGVSDDGNSSSCQILEIDLKSAPQTVRLPGKLIGVRRKSISGWLGASMATQDSSDLRVCGPRSMVAFIDIAHRGVELNMNDMRGVCFDLPQAMGNTLYRDSQNLKTYTFPIDDPQINALYGFSINYAERRNPNDVVRIIGEPSINQVEILYSNKTMMRSHHVHDLSNLGYSVSTGYYFDRNQVMFAAGAPAWLCKGMVTVFEANSKIEKRIEGSNLGEYFGASLTSGDFNGDGYDDLAVGAPHWGEIDYGRVYTFYSHDDGTFKEGLVLQGKYRSGLFGYTLASADLDRDGNSDLVVGAPWEQDSGAVHVFYGNIKFGTKDRLAPISQRILPSDFIPRVPTQRFGFAIASPVDVDDNGYPDLAIGAFKSGLAVLLKSKPVIATQINLFSYPEALQKSTRSFIVSVCLEYFGRRAPMNQALRIEMTIDEDHKRAETGSLKAFEALFRSNDIVCVNTTIMLMHGIMNFVDPIVIHVKHSITEADKSCSSCPVLRKPDFQENVQMTVPFDTGCKDGTICNASLFVAANFAGVRENDEWVVGSGDINLNLHVTNVGEPAYLTQLTIEIPPRIGLKNAIPSCIETLRGVALTLICDIDNPLEKGDVKDLTVGLDMSLITKSIGGAVLTFVVRRSTRSHDNELNNPIYINLILKNEASVRISGVSNEESRDYGKTEGKSTVPLRHAYQILKFGATPVTEAFLFVDVPIGILGRNESFLNISAPKLESSGRIYECVVNESKMNWRSVSATATAEAAYAMLQKRRRRNIEEQDIEDPKDFRNSPPDTVFGDSNYDAGNSSETDYNEYSSRDEATEVTAASRTTGETIYLNCSSDEVACATIKCRFGLLQTSEDMGNLVLDMVFNAKTFYQSDDDPLTIKFNTNATVVIIQPFASEPVNYSRLASAGASTMLYNIPQQQKLAGWILPGSIILGVFLFLLLAVILYVVGFFRRPKKVETEKAKEMEMILKKDNADDPFG